MNEADPPPVLKPKEPSVTNKQARWLAGVGFLAALAMGVTDGFAFYDANEVLTTAFLGASIAALGWPTWRNVAEYKADKA